MLDQNTKGKPAIVVGTNGSQRGHAALVRASILAYSRDAELHVVCAYERTDSANHRISREDAPCDVAYALTPRSEAHETMNEALAAARTMGVTAIGHVMREAAASALFHVATDIGAEAIVVGGSRKRSRLVEMISPSVARALAGTGICPIVVVDTAHGPVLRLVSNERKIVEVRALPNCAMAV